MAKPPVPLSLLLTKDVPYEWYDAVAIVSQLIAQAREAGLVSRLPEFRLIGLEEAGRVSVASPEPSTPAMPGAAFILQQLLSGKEQPAPLRLYAMQAATSDPIPSLDSFMTELSKFERPGRGLQLSQLYHRAFDLIGPTALLEANQDRSEPPLVMKTVAAPPPVTPKKKARPEDAPAGNRAAGIVLIVIAAAAAAGGYAWYSMHRPVPTPPPTAVEEKAETAAPAPSVAPRAAGARGGAVAAEGGEPDAPPATRVRRSAAVTSAENQLALARELFARQEYAAATAAFDRVLEMLGTENSPQAEELRHVASSLAEVARAAVAGQSTAPTRVYRSGEAGVTEPVPLSYLPPKPDPDTPPERLQVLEISITPDGHVDSAKFVMNRPSFRNSWWTSAAKAWRFQPAMKDGQPVPFVMRIVMDDAGAR